MTTQQNKTSKSSLFLMSAASGMAATCVVQPIDLIKTRMQLSGMMGGAKEHKTFLHAALNITRKEGFFGLYKGLTAGLFRQVTYTGTRLGIYTYLEDAYKGKYERNMPVHVKLMSACTAGSLGAIVGTPAEVALIRMTADGRLPPEQRRGYKNVFHALYNIYKNEGVASLWTGCGPTVARAVLVNVVQLVSYSEIKQALISKGIMNDGLGLYFTASLISGFCVAAATTPVDTIKTRIQNSKGEFKGISDVLVKTIKNEGPLSLMKGFTPFYLRIGPHTTIAFIVLEQLKKLAA